MFSTEEDGQIMRGSGGGSGANQNFNNGQNLAGMINNTSMVGGCGNFVVGQENDSFMNTGCLTNGNNTQPINFSIHNKRPSFGVQDPS